MKTNARALAAFRAQARRMQPTRRHRAALWENMLGTVYAMNPAGETRYFDYDYAAALAFVGKVEDVRVARFARTSPFGTAGKVYDDYTRPRTGQFVWFVVDAQPQATGERS